MLSFVSVASYGIGAASFALLTLLLLTAWRGRLLGGLLLAATVTTAIWAGILASFVDAGFVPLQSVGLLEVGRDIAWLLFLRGILTRADGGRGGARTIVLSIVVASALAIGLLGWFGGQVGGFSMSGRALTSAQLLTFVVLAIAGLALVEQLFRSTAHEDRWQIKFLCMGLGLQFAYDFFLYSHGLLFNHIDPALWTARGFIQALVVPFIAVTAVRNPEWSVQIFVSRHVVFQSAAVVGAGLYLLVMAGAGYYIQALGGSWGRTGQVVFLFGAVALLFVLLSSKQARSRAKVFLAKHFFRNKYDYRETWLAFTQILSTSDSDGELRQNIVQGIATLAESSGGVMWSLDNGRVFHRNAEWGTVPSTPSQLPSSAELLQFLKRTNWVIYVEDCVDDPAEYGGLPLPEWVTAGGFAVVMPLMHQGEIMGVVALMPSAPKRKYDWEDTDLLRTVGRQAASYLAHLRIAQALADARQFEAFNRLSSYVVHDLKNLVAQLALVVKNSERHLDNPAFVRDAIDTVANATGRMRRLLEQLRKGRLEETGTRLVNVGRIVRKVVAERGTELPVPDLGVVEEGLVITADADRLQNILGHVVQNAQEATANDGMVSVNAFHDGDAICIEVRDSGHGMDSEFIAERLFRPFDTTKGNAGMGIGVYETREFVNLWGGTVEVESEVGHGTLFRLRFPGDTLQAIAPVANAGGAS